MNRANFVMDTTRPINPVMRGAYPVFMDTRLDSK
jgi:hypothetical protein